MSTIIKIIIWMIAILIFSLVGMEIGVATEEKRYQSRASMIFKVGREYFYQPEFGNRQPIGSSRTDLSNAINTESHIMSSTPVLQDTIRSVGIDRYLSYTKASDNDSSSGTWDVENSTKIKTNADSMPLEIKLALATAHLADNLSIKYLANTNVVRINIEHENPVIAKDSLDALLDSFLVRRKEIYSDSSLSLMKQKLNESNTELDKAELELAKFSDASSIFSFDNQISSINEQIITNSENILNITVDVLETQSRLELITDRVNETPRNISLYVDKIPSLVVENAEARILELESEKIKLLSKYREGSQRVKQVTNEISDLREFIGKQVQFTTRSERQGRNPDYADLISQKISLESQLDSLTARKDSLEKLKISLHSQRQDLESVQNEYAQKLGRVELLKKRRNTFIEEVDRAQLAADVSNSVQSSARLLQRATLPRKPIGVTGAERMRLSASLGFAFGIFVLLIWSVLKMLLKNDKRGIQTNVQPNVQSIPLITQQD